MKPLEFARLEHATGLHLPSDYREALKGTHGRPDSDAFFMLMPKLDILLLWDASRRTKPELADFFQIGSDDDGNGFYIRHSLEHSPVYFLGGEGLIEFAADLRDFLGKCRRVESGADIRSVTEPEPPLIARLAGLAVVLSVLTLCVRWGVNKVLLFFQSYWFS